MIWKYFYRRLDPRFSKVWSRDCHLIFKRLILTHNFVLFIVAAFFRSSASKTKSNTKRDSRLKRRGEKKKTNKKRGGFGSGSRDERRSLRHQT